MGCCYLLLCYQLKSCVLDALSCFLFYGLHIIDLLDLPGHKLDLSHTLTYNLLTILTSTHLANVKPLVDSGRIVVGGAMLESHPAEGEDPKFKGSMLVALAESAAEVRELLSRDIYATEGVWDLENAQIIPVSFFFYLVLYSSSIPVDGYGRERLLTVFG